MKLYGLKCQAGYYYVSAESPDKALEKFKEYAQSYFSRYTDVTQIDIIATSAHDKKFITGHNFIP